MPIDEYEDFAAPVSAATSFLFSLASSRTKTTFMPILQFINSVLDSWVLLKSSHVLVVNPIPYLHNSNAPPNQKFGALNMTVSLGHFMMRHPSVRPNMEHFIVQHVFPEFNSQYPYMRAVVSGYYILFDGQYDLMW